MKKVNAKTIKYEAVADCPYCGTECFANILDKQYYPDEKEEWDACGHLKEVKEGKFYFATND
jgi:hypothetical protein